MLVVCERSNPTTEIIAANYAISIDADFKFIEGPNREDAEDLQRVLANLYELEVSERDKVSADVKGRLAEILKDVHFEHRKVITFITKGIPYGVAITNIPTAHLFTLFLGAVLAQIIIEEKRDVNIRAALLIDPGFFRESETNRICSLLEKDRLHCKVLADKQATVTEVSNAIDYYPYEFLFIASHVGELKGRRWHFKFKAMDQTEHIGVMDVAVCFAPIPGTDQVKVTEFKSLVSIDGVLRGSPAWKRLPTQLVKDYVYSEPQEGGIFKTEATERIQAAAAIQLHGGAFMPMMSILANHLAPVVFNNGCSSWIYLAERFIFAGARAYIGTLSAVNGLLAGPVAENFMELSLTGISITEAVWRSQGEVFKDSAIRPYAVVGCHFSTIKKSDTEQSASLIRYLGWSIRQWARKAEGPEPEDVQLYYREAVRVSTKYLNSLRGR